MSFDWTDFRSRPKCKAGTHDLTIVRVINETKDGTPLTTLSGDRKILVVYENDAGEEVSESYALSTRAAWRLQQLLTYIGIDLAALTQSGIEPADFIRPDIHDSYLIRKKVLAEVTYEQGTNGKSYARLSFLERPVTGRFPLEPLSDKPLPPMSDDVPF
jgi:hypothetical protein